MASSTTNSAQHPGSDSTTDAPQLGDFTPSSPLEMTNFMTPPEKNSPQETHPPQMETAPAPNAGQPSGPSTQPADPITSGTLEQTPEKPPPAVLKRSETEAIGPPSDNPSAHHDTSSGPAVLITIMLTNGNRHPYKVDEKYLRKRNIQSEGTLPGGGMDPYSISVYTLKELMWRDWREEWEPRPSSPSAIRLIYLGKMLKDSEPLKEYNFQTAAPNVLHMTVKPQELLDDEDGKTAKAGSGRGRDGEEATAGCRCVIL
ncbi:MAG: hypothetical protein M1820_000854 [Bogoriella megaspora]|nr:MAG: hypothetical protein M1820_000854 [Bogoriella megaspora]